MHITLNLWERTSFSYPQARRGVLFVIGRHASRKPSSFLKCTSYENLYGVRAMPNRGRKTSLLLVGLLTATLLLSGCTFWVRMTNGRVSQVTLPDGEIQRFLARMDALSQELFQGTQQLKDEGLKQVVAEMRQAYFRLVRQMGSNQRTPANPVELQLKIQAFEIQMARRLTTPQQTIRYHTLRVCFEQLKQETQRFFSVVERAAR